MKYFSISFILIIISSLGGCAVKLIDEGETNELMFSESFPIKLGLIADSQITSGNYNFESVWRSRFSDSIVGVSVRTPAQEYLAEDMLEVGLSILVSNDVDIILFLGDMANSGGADEIKNVFKILNDFQMQKNNPPIYIVIGNHDYLGTGNTSNMKTRCDVINLNKSCENIPLQKMEILKRISEYNNKNSGKNRFIYTDNYNDIDKTFFEKTAGNFLGKPKDDHLGLFLTGQIKNPKYPELEIHLVDTSDYKDIWFFPEYFSAEAYGLKGSISFKGRKISNFYYRT